MSKEVEYNQASDPWWKAHLLHLIEAQPEVVRGLGPGPELAQVLDNAVDAANQLAHQVASRKLHPEEPSPKTRKQAWAEAQEIALQEVIAPAEPLHRPEPAGPEETHFEAEVNEPVPLTGQPSRRGCCGGPRRGSTRRTSTAKDRGSPE
jgi:hypothetical protein